MQLSDGIVREADWLAKVGPLRGRAQWKVGSSMREFARLVLAEPFEGDVQANILDQIAPGLRVAHATASEVTQFDGYRGGKRQHDLALWADSGTERVAVSFEAKVTEEFGAVIRLKLKDAVRDNSDICMRLQLITNELWPRRSLNFIYDVRYQFFTGLYGTIRYAEDLGINKCVFCIYQIDVPGKVKVDRYKRDINALLRLFGRDEEDMSQGLFKYICKTRGGVDVYLSYLQRPMLPEAEAK